MSPIAATTTVRANRNVEVLRLRKGYFFMAESTSISGHRTTTVSAVAGLPSRAMVTIPAATRRAASQRGPRPKSARTAWKCWITNAALARSPWLTGRK
jgi:hypothetical protein